MATGVALMVALLLARGLHAQGNTAWAPQQPIPGYLPATLPPIMVADQNKTVHVFTSQMVGDGDNPDEFEDLVILYRTWTEADGWGPTNDIVISPYKQARIHGVYLDPEDVFHLVFFGGDDQGANLYYTWAPAALAGNAQAWAPPVAIGPQAVTPDVAGLVGDGKGNLVALYSGNLGEGNTLYALYSTDNGATWSDPDFVYSTYSPTDKPFDFQMAMGESGTVHIVWNVTNRAGQNVNGYYAQLEEIGGAWSEPMLLDTQRGLGVAIPAVTEYDGQVFVMYNNGLEEQVAPVQWFRSSSDGGKTWTQPLRPFSTHIGRNGSIAFAKDGNDTLHVFFGQRIPMGSDLTDIHGMWHATWLGTSWSPLQPVVSGVSNDSFDPYDARVVVSQGNVILLAWRTDPGRPINGTWYSYARVGAPELPVRPLAQPPAVIRPARTVDPAARLTPVPAATPKAQVVDFSASNEIRVMPPNPGMPLVIGFVPAMGLTLGVALVVFYRRRKRA